MKEEETKHRQRLLLLYRILYFLLVKVETSAVSTTNWMVETQLCKLRGTSTFIGRAYKKQNFIKNKISSGIRDVAAQGLSKSRRIKDVGGYFFPE